MGTFAQRFLKDPLFQFLVVGAVLFGLVSAVRGGAPDPSSPKEIDVTEAAVLTFLQFKLGAFEPAKAKERLSAMSPQERQDLIDDYVRNEVLVREAKGVGLSEDDAVIRQRLIQRMEFALESVVAPNEEPSDDALEAYLNSHADLFMEGPSVSFVHVFYRDGNVPPSDMALFASGGLEPGAALEMGDSFPYFDAYTDRTVRLVASHFGDAFTNQIFDAATPLDKWIGPISSSYGVHYVFISKRGAARLPKLGEIRNAVRDAYLRDQRSAAVEAAIDALTTSYNIKIAPELQAQ